MATFLDISALQYFSNIFTFLLIFVVLYALLEFGQVLGKDKSIHALISFSVAVLMLFSDKAVDVIMFSIPWFVIMIFFVFAIFLVLKMFGTSNESFAEVLKGPYGSRIVYWVISLAVIILLLGISNSYGQSVGPYLDNDTNDVSQLGDTIRGEGSVATGDFQQNLGATIFHPRVLGLMLIMLISTFTILNLTRNK